MSRLIQFLNKFIHILFYITATAVICGIFCQDNIFVNIIIIAIGLIGFCYIWYIIFILFPHRVKFDLHFVKDNFIYKIGFLVLSVPCIICTVVLLSTLCLKYKWSPKEMVFDENLYIESQIENIDTLKVIKFTKDIQSSGNDFISSISHIERRYPTAYSDSLKQGQKSPSLFWSIMLHYMDAGNQHMTTTKAGRDLSVIIAILGVILLNGLLISSIITKIDNRKEKWLKGTLRYSRFFKKHPHYIIIGGNDMVSGIVKQLFDKNENANRYILIQTSRDIEIFRKELFSELKTDKQDRVVFYYGNRNSKIDIDDLELENALEVYILGEEARMDDIESYHDTLNMKCLELLYEKCKHTSIGHQLKCRVLFEYQTTFSVFQFFDIDEQICEYIDFKPFNYYEMWAQKILINKELNCSKHKGYLPLEGIGGINKDSQSYAHIFIIGMSRMGIAMAIETAHLAHYPNYVTKNIRTKITFIDKNANEEMNNFIGRFRAMFDLAHWRYSCISDDGSIHWTKTYAPQGFEYLGSDFLDIEWEFIQAGIEENSVQDYIESCTKATDKVTIAVCLPESNQAHAAALYLKKSIYESVMQVLVYNRYGGIIIDKISESSQYPFKGKLKSFGYSSECYISEFIENSEFIAKEIEAAYSGNSQQNESKPKSKPTYSGKSQTASWWSNIYNGNTLWTKLRSIGKQSLPITLTQDEVDLLAKVEHNRWNIEQLLMNFRYISYDEFAQFPDKLTNPDKFKTHKNELKSKMVHLDICSNEKLNSIDPGVDKHDKELTVCLPDIIDKIQKREKQNNR